MYARRQVRMHAIQCMHVRECRAAPTYISITGQCPFTDTILTLQTPIDA